MAAGPGCRCCWGHRLLVPPGESVGQRDRGVGIAAAGDVLAGRSGLPDQRLFLALQLQLLRLQSLLLAVVGDGHLALIEGFNFGAQADTGVRGRFFASGCSYIEV